MEPGKIHLPLVRSGNCKLQFQFKKPSTNSDLQTVYVLSVRPSLISIDYDRRVNLSYYSS